MLINGRCHCRNIRYRLQWPGDGARIPVRACGCTFCTKHAGVWTSHRDSELVAMIRNESVISRYRFGTETADFYVCSACGVVPFVISAIENHLYAVVNINTFEGIDSSSFVRTETNFDRERTGSRLERRKQNWIHSVRILTSGTDAIESE